MRMYLKDLPGHESSGRKNVNFCFPEAKKDEQNAVKQIYALFFFLRKKKSILTHIHNLIFLFDNFGVQLFPAMVSRQFNFASFN